MAFLTIWGEPGCRTEEIARLTAQRTGFVLVTENRLRELIAEEFGSESAIPDKAYSAAVLSLLAHLGIKHSILLCAPCAELICRGLPSTLRCHIIAPETRRIGMLMLDHRLDRPDAKQLLRQLDRQYKEIRKKRFGRATAPASHFDVVINSEQFDSDQIAALLGDAVPARGLGADEPLAAAAEVQIQFQTRLQLARFGIHPAGKVSIKTKPFANASEEIFANMLDFYRIAWEYEPRSFPIQWDKDGRVIEAFTPDFYLPEFDAYIELTTMKQALVTKKNRKIKLLREMYPHVSIQVFYQKDFRNLIFKYGLIGKVTS